MGPLPSMGVLSQESGHRLWPCQGRGWCLVLREPGQRREVGG